MYIQKLLGRWVALIRKNIGTDKKAYINAETLESCLKQAFMEIKEEPCHCAGCTEEEIELNIEAKTNEDNEENDQVMDDQEFTDKLEQLDSIMRTTIGVIKSPKYTKEEKLREVNKAKNILIKERERLEERMSKGIRQGNLFDLLNKATKIPKMPKSGKLEDLLKNPNLFPQKMIGIRKNNKGEKEIIELTDPNEIREVLNDLLIDSNLKQAFTEMKEEPQNNPKKKNPFEDIENFFK